MVRDSDDRYTSPSLIRTVQRMHTLTMSPVRHADTSSRPTVPELQRRLAALGERVALDGPSAHERELAAFVVDLRLAGLTGPPVDVLGDLTAPPVVRCRAMGRLAVQLRGT